MSQEKDSPHTPINQCPLCPRLVYLDEDSVEYPLGSNQFLHLRVDEDRYSFEGHDEAWEPLNDAARRLVKRWKRKGRSRWGAEQGVERGPQDRGCRRRKTGESDKSSGGQR